MLQSWKQVKVGYPTSKLYRNSNLVRQQAPLANDSTSLTIKCLRPSMRLPLQMSGAYARIMVSFSRAGSLLFANCVIYVPMRMSSFMLGYSWLLKVSSCTPSRLNFDNSRNSLQQLKLSKLHPRKSSKLSCGIVFVTSLATSQEIPDINSSVRAGSLFCSKVIIFLSPQAKVMDLICPKQLPVMTVVAYRQEMLVTLGKVLLMNLNYPMRQTLLRVSKDQRVQLTSSEMLLQSILSFFSIGITLPLNVTIQFQLRSNSVIRGKIFPLNSFITPFCERYSWKSLRFGRQLLDIFNSLLYLKSRLCKSGRELSQNLVMLLPMRERETMAGSPACLAGGMERVKPFRFVLLKYSFCCVISQFQWMVDSNSSICLLVAITPAFKPLMLCCKSAFYLSQSPISCSICSFYSNNLSFSAFKLAFQDLGSEEELSTAKTIVVTSRTSDNMASRMMIFFMLLSLDLRRPSTCWYSSGKSIKYYIINPAQMQSIQEKNQALFCARIDYNQYDCFNQNTYIIKHNMQCEAQHASISNKPLLTIQCGCGSQFQTNDDFKDHALRVHNAQYMPHSTHFLTPYTFLVIPVRQTNNNRAPNVLGETASNLSKEKTSSKGRVTAIQSTRVQNTHYQQKERNKASNKKGRTAMSEMLVQPSMNDEQDQEVQWNGFRLLKNPKIQSKDFYCGKCQMTFTLPEQLIIHCLQVCQRLNYAKSSHFIVCDLPQIKTQSLPTAAIQLPFTEKQTKKQQQNEATKTCYMSQMNQMKNIIGDEIMELFDIYCSKEVPSFYCGSCRKTFPKSRIFARHMLESHSEIVHPDSSHIILRRKRGAFTSVIINCYIPHHEQYSDQEEKRYYCCCKPEVKMNLNRLIKHTLQLHKGISPIYGQQRTPTRPVPQLPPNQSVQPVRRVEEDPIRKIMSKKMGHNTAPFTCCSCNIKFDGVRSYRMHLQTKIREGNPQKASHIILLIKTRAIHYPIRPTLISVNQDWPIKEPIYYCPCQSARMAMPDLVEHISTIHGCVSPIYYGLYS